MIIALTKICALIINNDYYEFYKIEIYLASDKFRRVSGHAHHIGPGHCGPYFKQASNSGTIKFAFKIYAERKSSLCIKTFGCRRISR